MASTMTTQERPRDDGQSRRTNSHAITRWAGVLVAAIGGAVWSPLVGGIGMTPAQRTAVYYVAILALAILIAAISAWLLRTWWSLLIVPALFLLGYLIVGGVDEVVHSPQEYMFSNLLMLAIGGWMFLPPVLVGAAIGTAIANWMAARHHEPAAARQ